MTDKQVDTQVLVPASILRALITLAQDHLDQALEQPANDGRAGAQLDYDAANAVIDQACDLLDP